MAVALHEDFYMKKFDSCRSFNQKNETSWRLILTRMRPVLDGDVHFGILQGTKQDDFMSSQMFDLFCGKFMYLHTVTRQYQTLLSQFSESIIEGRGSQKFIQRKLQIRHSEIRDEGTFASEF